MAAKYRKNNSQFSQDKYLIAEQPGMAVLISGLILALFMGLIIRAMTSPSRVRAQVEKAAQSIHKDVRVKFDNAEVSFSNGVFPRLAVVVTNVVMESEQECWMKPRLEVDQIRLPISIVGLLRGRGVIREIQADTVKLKLNGEYTNCNQKNENKVITNKKTDNSSVVAKKNLNEDSSVSNPPKLVSLSQPEPTNEQKYSDIVRSVSVAKFQVELDKYPQYHAEFYDIAFQMKKLNPQWAELNAKTHLFRDEQVGDYLAHANIHLEYKDSPEPQVLAHFFGNWREGHYSFIANYSLVDKNLVFETDVKHIPFSQIVSLLQKYQMIDPSLNAKQLWLSFSSHYSGPAQEIKNHPLDISNVKIEGDKIDLGTAKISFKTLDPVKYDPFRVQIQKLSVDQLLSFYNRHVSTKALAHMGSFSGYADIVSGEDVRLFGSYSGLDFIFSNKGQREIQSIDQVETEAHFLNDQWKIHLSQLTTNSGSLKGQIDLVANKTFENLDFKLNLDEFVLDPKVQQLMSQGGVIGALSSQLDVKMREGQLTAVKGVIKAAPMKIEGLSLGATKIALDFAKSKTNFRFKPDAKSEAKEKGMVDSKTTENADFRPEIILNIQSSGIAMGPQSSAMKIVQTVFAPFAKTDADLQFDSFTGQIRTHEFKTLSWKNFSAQLKSGEKVTTEGSWNENAELTGAIQIKSKKNTQKWLIEGVRSQPQFSAIENLR